MIKFKLNQEKFGHPVDTITFFIKEVSGVEVKIEWKEDDEYMYTTYLKHEVIETFLDGWWLDVSDKEDVELKKEIGLIE